MPFTDPVSSVSGRNSRASIVSDLPAPPRSRQPLMPPAPEGIGAAGVLSMLKTSTDTGDIGALSFNHSRLPTMPRAVLQRRAPMARPAGPPHSFSMNTTSHHHHDPSQASRVSSQWDGSSRRLGSLTSMQSMPLSVGLTAGGGTSSVHAPASVHDSNDSRSYSMTSVLPARPLPRHRSVSSLKSQGHAPRHEAHVPPIPDLRPPYIYPTRLRRPGFRSPSPALSDGFVQAPSGMPVTSRGAQGPRSAPATAYYNYPGEYSGRYAPPPPPHLNAYPSDSVVAYPVAEGPLDSQAHYQSLPPRSRSAAPGPHAGPGSVPQFSRRLPQPIPTQYSPRLARAAKQHLPRAGYPQHAHPQQLSSRGMHSTAPASVAPAAHHIFHNAARMVRQIPQRIDTPINGVGSPGSNPPSSASAPTASNPPTPTDSTAQVTIDPTFIDPALDDLPDSPSDPILPARYFEYAEGRHKSVDDQDMDVPHPSVPPSGFVQRVRAMLESRAAIDSIETRRKGDAAMPEHAFELEANPSLENIVEMAELHEMPAHETPRFTIIEEFEAPVELPASPVLIAELSAGADSLPSQHVRITRELIKSKLAESSADNTADRVSTDDGDCADGGIEQRDEFQHHDEGKSLHNDDNDSKSGASAEAVASASDCLPARRHADPSRATTSSATLETRVPSGIDFALRFSRPTPTSTSGGTPATKAVELNADSIPIQHQQHKGNARPINAFTVTKRSLDTAERIDDPVSPLRPWEDNSRISAVSPLQERTMGIDETLHRLSSGTASDADVHDPPVPGSFPKASAELPDLETPETHAESMQCHSETNSPDTTTNRFSLPGDFSISGDTTAASCSELVTDVAVRFSLPQTSVGVGKACMINISPSSSPDQEKLRPTPLSFNPPRRERRSGSRNSVTFAEEVLSSNINRHVPQVTAHAGPPTTDTHASHTKSIMRKPLTQEEPSHPVTRAQDEGKDFRIRGASSAGQPTTANTEKRLGLGSGRLLGLKEESIEDVNVPDGKRHSVHQITLPARIAAVKAMQERRLQESAASAKARRHGHRYNRPLAEVRDLPSLHFSQMDLIDKLNEALDIRAVRSMDVVRSPDFSSIYCPSPQRPQSTDVLRGRYTSFFTKPEDFALFDSSDDDTDEDRGAEEHKAGVPALQIHEQTETDAEDTDDESEEEIVQNGLSPDELLSVAVEVNRLSIPSVSGLSERLSELLIPGLKNLQSLQIDSVLAPCHTGMLVSDGEVMRPPTSHADRSSTGFRLLAARAEEIVKHGTHDSMAHNFRVATLDKELPPLPLGDATAFTREDMNAVGEKSPHLSGSASAPSNLGKQMSSVPPLDALAPPPSTAEEVLQMLPPEGNPISRQARRTMVLSQLSSRPWNLDENYPWTADRVDIDLAVPTAAHARSSTHTGIIPPRKSRSLDLTADLDATGTSHDIGLTSTVTDNLNASMSLTDEQVTGVSTPHLCKQSVRSMMGSIGRRMGLTNYAAVEEEPAASQSPAAKPLHVTHASVDITSLRPGDRYPTTSLTPPATFTLDDVRSFFSETSSEKDRNASFRKRLTNLRSIGRGTKTVRIDPNGLHTAIPPSDGHAAPGVRTKAPHLLAPARHGIEHCAGAHSADFALDALAMGRAEFHLKRLGEKLRLLLARGGELFRAWSMRRGTGGAVRRRICRGHDADDDDDDDDWLADSLYSGA